MLFLPACTLGSHVFHYVGNCIALTLNSRRTPRHSPCRSRENRVCVVGVIIAAPPLIKGFRALAFGELSYYTANHFKVTELFRAYVGEQTYTAFVGTFLSAIQKLERLSSRKPCVIQGFFHVVNKILTNCKYYDKINYSLFYHNYNEGLLWNISHVT